MPRDVLISVMKKHQRYFPIQKDGKLLAHFIAIRNGDDIHIDIVREGNEHVLGARFADANFFVREDVKLKLEEYRPKLSSLTFHTKLGSMLDKSDRMLKLGAEIGGLLGFKDMPLIKTLARGLSLQSRPGHTDGHRDDLPARHHRR
ncbi:MAG: glycine--tRNA ligase subunit beta [Anaerolineales bacterium]|uniref:glycine--tRNA ligase subunit beta n=1 Tax=Candidatus Villigracilis vicinus TaxID=3140679 RepID=UPI003135DD29|nr:glycine--tRNA ligase subunit beta [Anaerolineales bacterium]